MTSDSKSKDQWLNPLRKQAEQLVSKPANRVSEMSPDDVERLVYDLEIHKEELEIQNEELRRIQIQLRQSCEQYSDLYDFAPVGYLTVDANVAIKEANLTASTMLGRERSKIIGSRLALYCDHQSRSQLRDHFESVRSTPLASHSCEVKFIKPNEDWFHARLDSNLVAGQDENWHCRVVITNITQQKESEQALIEKDNYLRSLADALPVLIGYFDKEFRVRFSNQAHVAWFRQTPEELLGRHVKEMFGYASAVGIEDYFADAMEGRRVDFETILVSETKGPRHVELMLVPDRGADGKVLGIHSLGIDITDRKVVEEQNVRRRIFGERLVCLNAAEKSVYDLLILGRSNKVIASELDIGLRTAERRRKHILEKLQVESVADLLHEIANIQGLDTL